MAALWVLVRNSVGETDEKGRTSEFFRHKLSLNRKQ